MNCDLSKTSGPDYISVVVLKNLELELSYISAEIFNKRLKESCFLDCWKVLLVAPLFKNVGESSAAKNEKCGLFSDFQCGLRSSLQGFIFGSTFFLLYINDLPDVAICNIAIYAGETTFYFKCDQGSDLWQQLELASELESDQQDTGRGQEVACLSQYCKNTTGFV